MSENRNVPRIKVNRREFGAKKVRHNLHNLKVKTQSPARENEEKTRARIFCFHDLSVRVDSVQSFNRGHQRGKTATRVENHVEKKKVEMCG